MANTLTIGQMRQRVVFYGNFATTAANDQREAVTTGGQNDQLAVILTTRGRLRKDSGGRNLSFGMIEGSDTYTLETRWDQTLVSVKVNGKVTVDAVEYTIASIEVIDQIKHLCRFKLNIETTA